MSAVPGMRVRASNEEPINAKGRFVVYWMLAARRTTWNFALQRAIEWARDLRKPLLVLEDLRCRNRWDSDRLHRFVLDGMRENAVACKRAAVGYYPYVESAPGEGAGLVPALAARACVVIADDFPAFVWPRLVSQTARQCRCRLEEVDSNGLLPLRATERAFPTAHAFRRFLQRALPEHLADFPKARPLARAGLPPFGAIPEEVRRRWPVASAQRLTGSPAALSSLAIDHTIPTVNTPGGSAAARVRLRRFLEAGLPRYAGERNQPGEEVTSGLSPYLHFGHISTHEVFAALMAQEGWSADALAPKAHGRRAGWWGVGENAEAFLDQLVTWRELGYNMSCHREDHDRYESLPAWARATLAVHASDPRPYCYPLEALKAGSTHDALWNAAQMQLVREGRLHNYLRMLWGKKILEWSPSPVEALAVMIELNNAYALDGRNPNSYSGIFWVLGRYDRPWGPERPIFGKVRYMSSENTARKVRVRRYVERYAP